MRMVDDTVPDFRALFESAPAAYLVLRPDLTIAAVSDAYLHATITRREAIVGRGLFEVFPDNPSDPSATGTRNLRASLDRVLRQRRADAMAVQKYDIPRPAAEGGGFEERYWSPVNSPVLGPGGDVVYVVHRVEDVTDFVRLKAQGSEQHRVTEELRSRTAQMETEIFRRAQEIQEANTQLRLLQAHLEAQVDERTAELRSANEGLLREIAERRRAEDTLRRTEEQLRQAQKLEAVGRLAGGIAHDFNNLLSVLLMCGHSMREQLAPDAPLQDDVTEVLEASERAAGLTRQLLAFSRQQVLEPKIVNFNEILLRMEKMLRRVIGEDLKLRTVTQADLGSTWVDPGQIEQVVMNLVINARDAMADGGALSIETANVHLDEEYASQHPGVAAGDYVMLAVTDTGTGMDSATQARIFEPFFTTKGAGKGTGLGLSTVYGIVRQSGGHVWVYSEPGKGTTFKAYFRRTAESAAAATIAASPRRARVGRETILLVEDEPQVRRAVWRTLHRGGYEVLESDCPSEALRVCKEHGGRIDLLLTDVVMPEMNGRALAEEITRRRPGIRVLFMSGYTNDTVVHHGVLEASVAFLQKPVISETLLRKVGEVLEAQP